MALEGTVRIPGMGEVSRRGLALAAAGGAAVVVLLWWRKRGGAAAAAGADLPVEGTDEFTGADDGLGEFGGGGAGVPGTTGTGAIPQPGATNSAWTAEVLEAWGGDTTDRATMLQALGLYLAGRAVTTAQESLIEQAIALADYPPVQGADGYPPAIRRQPPTGQAPRPSSPAPRPTTTGTTTGTSHPTLRMGSRGSAVSEAQTALNRHGAHLAVDGIFGPLTYNAVVNFQRQQRIAVDGIIGPITWSRLT